MRPRLHRAAKIRVILRLAAFTAVVAAFLSAGGLIGATSVPTQVMLAASAFALLVLPTLLPLIQPSRARATMPRTLSPGLAE